MTADEFRRIVLSLQGTIERAHMGHPDFRANGKIFASLHSNDRLGMVKLTPEEQKAVMRSAPESFEPSSGAWGLRGYTNVRLATADVPAVRGAVLLAYEGVRSKPPARAPERKAPGKATRKRRT